MVYPFEQAAIRGEELPDGLSAAEQFLFIALRNLYKAKRLDLIDREQGACEKKKLEREYGNLVFLQRHVDASAKLFRRIEAAVQTVSSDCELMKNDAVVGLLNAIYGGVYKTDENKRSRLDGSENIS